MGSEGSGRRVLVVEDEMLVGMLIEDVLQDLGLEVAGIANRVGDAVAMAREAEVDLAVLDVNLDGQPSYPVADALRARGVPFVFVTGYGQAGVDPAYAGTPTLQKPFRHADLEALIRGILPV